MARRPSRGSTGGPLNLRSQERELIRRALEHYKGNRKKAAEALSISTVTLWRKMKEYELTNFRVTMLNADAAVVTYNVDAHAVIQGNEVSMHNAVTAGWAKREGKWLNVSAVASARA